jgi:hypothetical protein
MFRPGVRVANDRLVPVDPGWTAAVLVCGNQRPPGAEKASCGADGVALREGLKAACRAAGERDRVVVAQTTCLGVCSPWGVTVAVLAHGRRAMWVVPRDASADQVWPAVQRATEER